MFIKGKRLISSPFQFPVPNSEDAFFLHSLAKRPQMHLIQLFDHLSHSKPETRNGADSHMVHP